MHHQSTLWKWIVSTCFVLLRSRKGYYYGSELDEWQFSLHRICLCISCDWRYWEVKKNMKNINKMQLNNENFVDFHFPHLFVWLLQTKPNILCAKIFILFSIFFVYLQFAAKCSNKSNSVWSHDQYVLFNFTSNVIFPPAFLPLLPLCIVFIE